MLHINLKKFQLIWWPKITRKVRYPSLGRTGRSQGTRWDQDPKQTSFIAYYLSMSCSQQVASRRELGSYEGFGNDCSFYLLAVVWSPTFVRSCVFTCAPRTTQGCREKAAIKTARFCTQAYTLIKQCNVYVLDGSDDWFNQCQENTVTLAT